MQIEVVDISSLSFDPANARKHPEKNLAAIEGSLRKFGQRKPIVTRNNVVIAGNGTLAAAKKLGWQTIQIVRADDLSATDAAGFALADNRTAEIAEWDVDALQSSLKGLLDDGFDLAQIGFDAEDLSKLLPEPEPIFDGDPDDVPENVDTRCKPGDLWQLGNHRLLCGDSTNVQHVERLMNGDSAGLCFTSPPYADQREYNGGKELSTQHLASFISSAHGVCNLFAVNLGISRKNNELNTYWDDYIKEANSCGLRLISWNIWDKGEAGSLGNQTATFPIEHEFIFIFARDKIEVKRTVEAKHAGAISTALNRERDGSSTKRTHSVHEFKKMGSVFRAGPERVQAAALGHPAIFPVALPTAYIESCTNVESVVYEPFLGSGSTLIACEKTNRKCYGMEIDPHYCDVILERWEKFTGKKAELLPND